jgi:hypothetical protein
MELINDLKEILTNEDFVKTNNFYYEKHFCNSINKTEKVELKYKISLDSSDKIVKLGKCKHCNLVFYNENFE